MERDLCYLNNGATKCLFQQSFQLAQVPATATVSEGQKYAKAPVHRPRGERYRTQDALQQTSSVSSVLVQTEVSAKECKHSRQEQKTQTLLLCLYRPLSWQCLYPVVISASHCWLNAIPRLAQNDQVG